MAAAFRGSPSVLIVDDDTASLAALAEVLSLEGYSVVTARNGIEALERLRSSPQLSLMILDLVMPRMDGLELLKRKRGDPFMAAVPVIVLSGIEGKLDGVISLRKPLNLEHLFTAMRALTGPEAASPRV